MANPLETALANSQVTYNLIEMSKRNGARFLMASTSEAYGDRSNLKRRVLGP